MKFILDTADTAAIKRFNEILTIDGVTTNPSIITKSGKDFDVVVKEIIDILDIEQKLFIQAVSTDCAGIVEEAKNSVYFQLVQPDPTLESGNTGWIQVVLDSREDVLYINKNVIKTNQGKNFVYVLNDEGLRESRDVTVGKVFGDVVEVLDGLKEGESVILN